MTQERFFQILAAYGADPKRWPEAERTAARAFAAAHPDLVGPALAEQGRLDEHLGSAGMAPSDLLQRRLLAALPSQARPGSSAGAPAWSIPVAAAAALVLGVLAGFAGGAVTAPVPEEGPLYAEAFGGLGEDWVDWLGDDA